MHQASLNIVTHWRNHIRTSIRCFPWGGFFFILFRPNYNKSPSSSVHDANDPTLPRKQNLVLDKALEIKAVFMVVSEIILAESSPSSSWSADWAS
jgi:hypothetical protein